MQKLDHEKFSLAAREELDSLARSLLRSQIGPESVNLLVKDLPKVRYPWLAEEISQDIARVQPYIDTDLSANEAYELVLAVSPSELLKKHAKIAVLALGLRQFTPGLGWVINLQATGGEFADDEVLKSSAKLGFAIASLAVQAREAAQLLYQTTMQCEACLSVRGGKASANHSEDAVLYCLQFWRLLRLFAMNNAATDQSGRTDQSRYILFQTARNAAVQLDNASQSRLGIVEWVGIMAKQSGD